MDVQLTASQLTEHFVETLEELDRGPANATHGNEPHYPLIVFFLGREAMEGYESISSHLVHMWPQYRDELQFYGIEHAGEDLAYYRLGGAGPRKVDVDDVGDALDALDASSNHFENHERKLLYFVLNSATMKSGEELDVWLETIERFKHELYIDEYEILQMLFLLLDESRPKRRVAAGVRNVLAPRCDGDEPSPYPIVLMSNRLMSNEFKRSWEDHYRICASLIALSDNKDDIVNTLFYQGVATVSYVREEKPVHDIGQVIVGSLIDYLSEALNSQDDDESIARNLRIGGQELATRLGLNDDRVLQWLVDYVDSDLVPMLPDDATIACFPRRSCENLPNLARCEAGKLDEVTMGTWSASVAEVARYGQERIEEGSRLCEAWQDAYNAYLLDEFSSKELTQLAEHIEEVRSMLMSARKPSPQGPAREYARLMLRTLLSADEHVADVFLSVIERQAEQSHELKDEWDKLRESLRDMYDVHDVNLRDFYKDKARRYFDTEGDRLSADFCGMGSARALRALLFDALERLAKSDSVFAANFDDELRSRLNLDGREREARAYIQEKLTGKNVRTYLHFGFSLGTTFCSTALLKGGTSLSADLKGFLPETTYYYDTGDGGTVEILNLSEVKRENLLG